MKILYITFLEPSEKFGGGIQVVKSLMALSKIGEIDYIGPHITEDIDGIQIHKAYYLEKQDSALHRLLNYIVSGSASCFFKSWKQAVNNITTENYDLIYMERTLQGFAAKWAALTGKPFIVMSHNVEYDYFKAQHRSILNLMKVHNAKKNERICVESCDKLIALTPYDRSRFCKLYGNNNKIDVIPVCVKRMYSIESFSHNKKYILLSGSLWFGPNVDGAIWFLENVWSRLYKLIGDQFDLLLVGSNPNEDILDWCNRLPCTLVIPNPQSMRPYYNGASIFVAPIFRGSGMKVKIAEALSCGLPIVTTTHASIGYEKVNDLIYKSDDAESFCNSIKQIVDGNEYLNSERKERTLKAFDSNFSFDAFQSDISKEIDSLLAE